MLNAVAGADAAKGVLRRALRAMLAGHPHVTTVTEAAQAEGGAGATIVDLRQ